MVETGLRLQLDPQQDLHVISDSHFARLDENDFGAPGLVAIESVGPFVELGQVGPFVTIHDSFMEPGLGIGHHPHRYHERLFYILSGEVGHDDALNHITGQMSEGDLAQLTEGERGMLHKEWNQAPGVRTHIFILVYRPDVDPPPPTASFAALRAADRPIYKEGDGAETTELVGSRSAFRPNLNRLHFFGDTSLDSGGSVAIEMRPNEGTILYALKGQIALEQLSQSIELLGTGDSWPEGPNAIALVWSNDAPRTLQLRSTNGAARFIRVTFARGEDELLLHQPYQRRV